ncbi:cytoskeleton-associated protein 4 isoform X2 [Larimichthys crocea]|uniref:cytoskeleton-associated protein 4 isoform X2 n=1 Tax=Larimichthys crocea TaxID=215358 RepID=UPI000F5DBF7B|nr:cytoskeleton-associated protein 4 isoform X2 [Larimichthys crocea]
MTAKNRNKSNSSEKSAASIQDDAPKKIQKSTSTNGVSSPGSQAAKSGSCLGLIATTVFYLGLIGAAGFAAFYLQQVVEEMHQTSARHEESARQNAVLGSKMESVVQQVESLKSVVDGLESSLGITRVELEGAVSRMKRGEVETRRVEEALQKLQNDLLRDLSEGIKEVKEAREWDFSSLEKTVEERLAEVSQSVKASVTEFTEAQGEAQRELADLKARLGDIEDPALIKQELSAIVDVVAEIRTTKQDSDASSESLREQIFAVRSELQTRNREVASLSEEIETVRSVMQDTVESLRQSLSSTKADIQALKDKGMTLESSVEQAADAVRYVEKKANEAADQVRRQSEDLEERVKASEVSGDSLMVSVSDITSKVETLLTKYDTHESTLAEQKQAVEKVKSGLGEEMEALKSSLGELQSNIVALGEAQNELTTKDSDLDQLVKELGERFAALEGKSNVEPEQMQSLRGMVDGLEAKAAKLEGHDQAISALQEALQETTRTLAGLAKVDDQVEEEEERTEEEEHTNEEEESEV